jgi:3-(3-hydroxy-phenyl)propionate hydroxylase
MLDRILGSGWAVIGVGVSADQWREGKRIADCTAATTVHAPLDDKWPRGMPVDRVMIDVDGGLGRELAPYSGKFLLIRPDKIIAAVWDTSETDTVCAVVSRWSTRPGSN